MLRRFAQDLGANQRNQGIAFEQAVDWPNADIARLHYVLALQTHCQANAASKPLDPADRVDEKFRRFQFQHTHGLAPWLWLLRNSLLRPGHHNQRLWNNSSKAYCRAVSFYIARLVENESAAIFASHNRKWVESKTPVKSHSVSDAKALITGPAYGSEHHGQREQDQRGDEKPVIHHPRLTPRAATHPSDGQLRAFASAFSFSRVGTRTSAHSERPAVPSSSAGRFVSEVAQ